MSETSTRSALGEALRQSRIIRLERSVVSDGVDNGFVVAVSDKLILLHQFFDFFSYGFRVLPLADIEEFCSGENERFFERVVADRGIQRLEIPEVEISSWLGFLSSLQESGKLLAVETKPTPTADDESLYVGIVSEVTESSVWIMPCTASGRWQDEEIRVQLESVASVEFETPYLETLYEYLPQLA